MCDTEQRGPQAPGALAARCSWGTGYGKASFGGSPGAQPAHYKGKGKGSLMIRGYLGLGGVDLFEAHTKRSRPDWSPFHLS